MSFLWYLLTFNYFKSVKLLKNIEMRNIYLQIGTELHLNENGWRKYCFLHIYNHAISTKHRQNILEMSEFILRKRFQIHLFVICRKLFRVLLKNELISIGAEIPPLVYKCSWDSCTFFSINISYLTFYKYTLYVFKRNYYYYVNNYKKENPCLNYCMKTWIFVIIFWFQILIDVKMN